MNTLDYTNFKIALPEAPVWLGASRNLEQGSICVVFDNGEVEGELIEFNYAGKYLRLNTEPEAGDKQISFDAIRYCFFPNKNQLSSEKIPAIFKYPGVELPDQREDYRVTLNNGHVLDGKMASYVKDDCGIHIFKIEEDCLLRYFVPHSAIKEQYMGNKIGNELLSSHVSKASELSQALRNQQSYKNIKLGEVLLEYDLIDEADLEKVIKIQDSIKYKKNIKIGELLIQNNILTQKQLDNAIKAQVRKKKAKLGQILVDMGVASDLDISRVLARKLGLPLIHLDEFRASKKLLADFPYLEAKQNSMLPLGTFENRILLGLSDPFNQSAIDSLQRSHADKIIEIALIPESQLDHAFSIYFGREVIKEKFDSLEGSHAEFTQESWSESQSSDRYLSLVNSTATSEALNSILLDSIDRNVDEIQFSPEHYQVSVKYRVKGHTEHIFDFHIGLLNLISNRLRVIGNLTIAGYDLPQTGSASVQYRNKWVSFVFSLLPTQHGENISIQLKGRPADKLKFEDMGFDKEDSVLISNSLKREHGLVLMLGPKSSGKSLSCCSAARELGAYKQHVIMLANPPLQDLEEVTQINLGNFPDIGVSGFLRSAFIRHPGAVLLDGSYEEPAIMSLVQKSLNKTLVVMTVENNSLSQAFFNISSIPGIRPDMLEKTLSLVIVHRLAKKNCQHCLVEEEAEPAALTLLGADSAEFYTSQGCDLCEDRGHSGKQLVYAVLSPEDLSQGDEVSEIDVEKIRIQALKLAQDKIISSQEACRLVRSFD